MFFTLFFTLVSINVVAGGVPSYSTISAGRLVDVTNPVARSSVLPDTVGALQLSVIDCRSTVAVGNWERCRWWRPVIQLHAQTGIAEAGVSQTQSPSPESPRPESPKPESPRPESPVPNRRRQVLFPHREREFDDVPSAANLPQVDVSPIMDAGSFEVPL